MRYLCIIAIAISLDLEAMVHYYWSLNLCSRLLPDTGVNNWMKIGFGRHLNLVRKIALPLMGAGLISDFHLGRLGSFQGGLLFG